MQPCNEACICAGAPRCASSVWMLMLKRMRLSDDAAVLYQVVVCLVVDGRDYMQARKE